MALPFDSLEEARHLVQAALPAPAAVCENNSASCELRGGRNSVKVSVPPSLDQIDLICLIAMKSPESRIFSDACLHAERALGMSPEFATTCVQNHQEVRRIGNLDYGCMLVPLPGVTGIRVNVVRHGR
ncbi:hypothetical protein LAZ40_04605 [Cereibacter sphaeroides]|uniref:hypothetical protein n=1 Tax=Cereibacter sphaeroides TaxID=1063 RepID=UPI001F4191E7|nr:hypothetical protein [Cereibacter sphaeroides]MCE6958336.1 hypothetical protein [Cereibacter sphaeroides]MCE6972203.1 hypothetical protein [Cereibacter sphaeroides]